VLRLLLVFAPAVLFGQGSVTGRVVDALTGAPLPGAKVALYSNLSPPTGWQATSDSDGKFLLPDIPAGDTYRLTATKRTYLPGNKPQYRGQAPLEIGASGLTGITLPLIPQSVLAGTVIDASGQLAEGVHLNARRIPFSETVKKRLDTETIAITDDLGRFRLAGLKPGDYHIVRYYEQNLARYTLSPGQQLDSLRLVLPPTVVYSVRVRLSGIPSPPYELTPRLRPGDHFGEAQPDGSFLFPRVPPGSYTAVAASRDYFATAPVSVRNADVSGIQLRPAPRATLRGRVRVEGPRTVPLQGLRLTIQATHANGLMFPTTTDATGAFSVPGFPTGPAEIDIVAPAGAYLRKIQTTNGLTEIVLSTATATLEGTVDPPSDGQRFVAGIVYLVPEGQWLGALRNPDRYQAYVTAELTFSMRDLAPGRYIAIAAETYLIEGVSAERLHALKAFTKIIDLAAGPSRKIVLPHTRVEHLLAGSIDIV